jgi:hypothetical protein
MQQTSSKLDALVANTIGQETVVPDTDEASREHVEQEASDELDARDRHGPLLSRGAVLPPEFDLLVIDGDDALVGDGDAVGVASQILQDLGWATEGWLGVDDPLLAAEVGDRAGPGGEIAKSFELAVELDLAVSVGGFESLQIQTSKQPAEHAHRQEEVSSAGDPSLSVAGDSSAGDDAVHVGVMEQDLAPGVKDGKKADVRTEMLGICGDGEQGLRGGMEEQAVAQTLVLQRDRRQFVGEREDDVEVRDVEELALAGREPFGSRRSPTLGTVSVATGVVGDLFVATGVAAKLVAAERSRPAERELAKYALLLGRARVGLAIGDSEGSQDVGHFGPTRIHGESRVALLSRSVASAVVCGAEVATWR